MPLIVCGPAPEERRREVMAALLRVATLRSDDESAPQPEPAAIGAPDAWSAAHSARVLALRPGDPFAMVVEADSLRDLMARLTAGPGGLSSDEVRALGLVLVIGRDGRVDAAHLLRPVERDAQDHLQRRPPAVLASRDPSTGNLDHFAWGITPELADRVDLSERDLDRRLAARREVLVRLVAAGGDAREEQRRLAEHLAAEPPREPAPERPRARDPWPSRQDDHLH